jgi:hypothetical protein
LFQLISVGLLFVAFIFLIVAAATTGWIVIGSTNIGLFTVCGGGGYCVSTLDAFSNQSSCRSRDQAAQAFVVLAILALFPLMCTVAVRRFIGQTDAGVLVGKYVPWWADVVTAAVIVFFLTITWGAVANFYSDCVCNNAGTAACGLNYSWALCFIAWCFVGASGVLMFLTHEEDHCVVCKPVQAHPHDSTNGGNAQFDSAHAA